MKEKVIIHRKRSSPRKLSPTRYITLLYSEFRRHLEFLPCFSPKRNIFFKKKRKANRTFLGFEKSNRILSIVAPIENYRDRERGRKFCTSYTSVGRRPNLTAIRFIVKKEKKKKKTQTNKFLTRVRLANLSQSVVFLGAQEAENLISKLITRSETCERLSYFGLSYILHRHPIL